MKILLVTISFLLVSCTIISPGERGVRIALGKANNNFLAPGIHLWIPIIYGVSSIDVQIQKSEVESEAASKDMQTIHANIALNWHINEKSVVEIYRNIGDENAIYERLISPAVNEVLKAETAKHSAEEVLTKRMDLKKAIDDSLRQRLSTYGITITDISIVNLKFSKDYSRAIEEKQIAEQSAKKAEYDALKATQEAKAVVNLAKGQAEAQTMLKTTLTPELLKLKAIEKWDGRLPHIIGGNNMMFNLPVGNTDK